MWISDAESILSDLSGYELKGFRGLGWSWSCPVFHAHFSASFHACTGLCCAYLQQPEKGCLSQKSTALLQYVPPLQTHLVLFHSMLLPTILGWLHSHSIIGIQEIHIIPLSSGLLYQPLNIFQKTKEVKEYFGIQAWYKQCSLNTLTSLFSYESPFISLRIE